MHKVRVRVVEDALDANNTIARANREDFDRAGVKVVNLMSAPGAGKTALLERVLADTGDVRVAVLEGDVEGSLDAQRLASLHVPVVQLNTSGGFGGECHLDANMVRSALPSLPLEDIDLLVIENVGNLVCPAEFRVGEDVRAMVCSVAEGEDKPLKYPLMFRACELVVVNKIDTADPVVLQALRGDPLTVFGTGKQVRCFCHVLDVVPALIRLVAADSACGRAVNFGSSEQVSIEELAHRVIAATGSPSTIRSVSYQEAYGSGYEDMQRRVPDCGLAWDLVGFRARRSLDEIIESVISDQAARTAAVAGAAS